VRNYADLLLSMGFDSVERSAEDAGLGMALGNAPVSLLELARAFSVFPRDGNYISETYALAGQDYEPKQKRIFSADTSRLICSFISDSSARVLAFGSGRNFATAVPAIVKTGTANQYQSIVALGATPKYTAGVWMGNFTGETIVGRTGSSLPAAVARDALQYLQGQARNVKLDFPRPENWKLRRICAVSGMAPTAACLSVIEEYAGLEETQSPCTWHVMANGKTETIFPAEYQGWFNSAERQGSVDYSSRPLEIVTPRGGFVYLSSPGIGNDGIPVEVIGGESDILHITHNENSFTASRPFAFNLPRVRGVNRLYVENAGENAELAFTVE
jgi:penicillin-binding protein 1C